ncbi:unc-13 homolog D-like protein, putative [Babesia caballi]|uniref:Unc-13 homolog D-like protein, putative n=1 Tax=Babesia caballi TaxID=5871 RepID=A0AAV4LRT3_BABCB|nr:unc-13 homolog D-like protein, putative [Babesia caballi]
MRCLGALLRPSRGAALGAAARSVASAADLGSHSSGGVGMSVSGEHTARSGSGVAAAAQAVVLQEPRTLCRAVVQASREGKRGKVGRYGDRIHEAGHVEGAHTEGDRDPGPAQLQAGRHRHPQLRQRRGRPGAAARPFAGAGGEDPGAPGERRGILHGAVSAGYSNVEMNKMMKQAVLGQFQHMLETGQHNKPQGFIFEDLAGIMHAFAQMQVPLERAEAMLVHDLFMALYEKDASEASTISHRAFAISVNTLERLGCHTAELFRVASGHLRRHIDAMCSIKDLAMVYCAAARTHAALFAAEEREECVVGGATRGTVVGEQSRRREASGEATSSDTWEGSGDYVVEQLRGCLQTRGNVPVGHITPLTALVLDRLTQPGKMAGGDEIDAQSIANIAAHAAVHVEGGDLQKRFREFVSSAVTRVMQNTDVDHTSLVHLMKCAIRANLVQEATLMLGAKHVYTVGMLAAPLEFAQHVANVNALRGQQSDSKVLEVLDSVAVTNMLQFHRRLLMPPVTVKPQPRRRRTLRDLIEAACQRETPSEPICIYNELDKCYKGGDGLRMCAKTIAAVSGFSGHKAAVDIAQKMVEYMEHMCVSGAVLRDMESVAAVATALSRWVGTALAVIDGQVQDEGGAAAPANGGGGDSTVAGDDACGSSSADAGGVREAGVPG